MTAIRYRAIIQLASSCLTGHLKDQKGSRTGQLDQAEKFGSINLDLCEGGMIVGRLSVITLLLFFGAASIWAGDDGMGGSAAQAAPAKEQSAPRPIWTGHENLPERQDDDQTWTLFSQAMLDFQNGSLSRGRFLSTCRQLLEEHPGSRYEAQWEDLISALEREAVIGEPPFVGKPVGERSEDEEIGYWIFRLRDVGGSQISSPDEPMVFGLGKEEPNPADRLVHIGPAAIPQLINALTDNTPTRTLAWQRKFYSVWFVLRREDIALKCLERIVGCRFYDEGSSSMHFHMDTPQRRESVLENIRLWWRDSEGKSQAQMIRNQLALMGGNITLRGYEEISALETLAMLEGPRAVIERATQLLEEDQYGLNSPIVALMNKIDRQSVIRASMRRFWENRSKGGDYTTLLKYGDRAVYQEIARRFEEAGKLDSGAWSTGEQVRLASQCGKNWAIPIAATMLRQTKITGSRYRAGKGTQDFGAADDAIEVFAELTGRDFGYEPAAPVEARLAAINRAREWWEKTGREELREKVAADHSPTMDMGDLLSTDAEIDESVKAIAGTDDALRAKVLGELGAVYSWRVQMALIERLAKTDDTRERLAILGVVQRHPSLWMLPTIAALFRDTESDSALRLLAGQITGDVLADKNTSIWWQRMETRDVALAAAREVLSGGDKPQPAEIQNQAAAILQAWGQWDDLRLVERWRAPVVP